MLPEKSHPTTRQEIPADHAIWLDRLSVTYRGGHRALDTVSLGFRRGEITVLLGTSGAGKSTLLRSLNLLVPPTGGAVHSALLGQLDPRRAGGRGRLRAHRRATAMIFQSHQLIGRHTALANVLFGRLGHHATLRSFLPLPRADRLLALDCLRRVGLLDRALARTDRLSGGQQQRVGIARALCQQPSLVLADEPVASLDPATSETVLSILRSVCKTEHLTAIVSLHQLDYALRFADRIIGLSGGAVVFDGPPETMNDAAIAAIYGAGTTPLSGRAAPHQTSIRNPLMQPSIQEAS